MKTMPKNEELIQEYRDAIVGGNARIVLLEKRIVRIKTQTAILQHAIEAIERGKKALQTQSPV